MPERAPTLVCPECYELIRISLFELTTSKSINCPYCSAELRLLREDGARPPGAPGSNDLGQADG